MPFSAFPIYDYRSGLNLAVEPWKTPPDAFVSLKNVFFRRGIAHKRDGQSVFGQLGKFVSAETGFANPAGNQYTITLANTIVIRKSLKVYDDGGAQALYDDGEGTFTGNGTGTIDYDTGAIDVTFTGAIVGNVDADYHYEIDEDTRRVNQFNRYTGSNTLIGFQTKRMSLWDGTREYFANVASVGGDYELWNSDNLVWTWAYNDNLWITDNSVYTTGGAFPVNGIRYYNSSVIRDPIADDGSLQTTSNAADVIKAALIIFTFHERVMFLATVEGAASTYYPQRVTGSWVGDPLAAQAWRRDIPGSGWRKDAATNENIVSFTMFGEMPIIGFEHSIWTLDYTGDPNDPVDWRRLGSKDVSATFSGVEYITASGFVGGKGLVYTDGKICDYFDKNIPDFVESSIDIDNIDKVYAGSADNLDQILFAYPSFPSAEKNDAVLIYNYIDKSFSQYDMSCYCFGNWITSTDRTFDSYAGETFDDLAGVKWGDSSMQAGYPLLLSGNEKGYVYLINDGEAETDVTDWDGTETIIDFEMKSGRFNPFVKEGRQVQLQQVGFYVTKDEYAQFSVDFHVDEELSVVETAIVDCTTGKGDKMWVFADAGISGDFVSMRLYLSEDQKADAHIPLQQIEIHGMVLWLQAGSRIQQQ